MVKYILSILETMELIITKKLTGKNILLREMLVGYRKTMSFEFWFFFKQDLLLALNFWAQMILNLPNICNCRHVVTESAKSRFFLLLFLAAFEFGPHVVEAHLGNSPARLPVLELHVLPCPAKECFLMNLCYCSMRCVTGGIFEDVYTVFRGRGLMNHNAWARSDLPPGFCITHEFKVFGFFYRFQWIGVG